MRTARSNSNHESRKTIRHSTAMAPTSRSAAAPTRYSSATSPWHAKRQRATIELPPRISTSMRNTIFRINNARREGDQQGTPRPTTPADVEMNSSQADSTEVDVDRFQPQWDGEDSV